MQTFVVSQFSIPVPESLMQLDPQTIGVCTKAISIALSSTGVIKLPELIKKLCSWSDLNQEEIQLALIIGFNLKAESFTAQAVIAEPSIKITKKKLQIKKSESLDDDAFTESCKTAFPVLDIDKEKILFVKTFRERGFVTTQQGFLNWCQRKITEENILSAKICPVCDGTKEVEEFFAGEGRMVPCPACSE